MTDRLEVHNFILSESHPDWYDSINRDIDGSEENNSDLHGGKYWIRYEDKKGLMHSVKIVNGQIAGSVCYDK